MGLPNFQFVGSKDVVVCTIVTALVDRELLFRIRKLVIPVSEGNPVVASAENLGAISANSGEVSSFPVSRLQAESHTLFPPCFIHFPSTELNRCTWRRVVKRRSRGSAYWIPDSSKSRGRSSKVGYL